MGLFDRAKENFENRQKVAEYNARAREYVQEGQELYKNAYDSLWDACDNVKEKVDKFISFKQKVLSEMNSTLRKIDSNHSDLKLSLQVNLPMLEGCAVSPGFKITEFEHIITTLTLPSISDFFCDVDVYEAKANMQRAKSYKNEMKAKREQLKNAKYAVKEIPSFMSDERQKIEQLMDKFRKTADSIGKGNDKEKSESLCEIAQLIADSLTTQFIDNNYQITDQYNEIHRRIERINDSLSDSNWLIG